MRTLFSLPLLIAVAAVLFAAMPATFAGETNYTPLVRGAPGGGVDLILRHVQSGKPVRVAQDECPAGYPLDCADGHCCPAGTSCCTDGCCPGGYPHRCGSQCYVTLQDAVDAGCSMNEIEVCGVPQ